MKKPAMRAEWAGQKGNKFRVYKVTNSEGKEMLFANKNDATRVFNAGQTVFKILQKQKGGK